MKKKLITRYENIVSPIDDNPTLVNIDKALSLNFDLLNSYDGENMDKEAHVLF